MKSICMSVLSLVVTLLSIGCILASPPQAPDLPQALPILVVTPTPTPTPHRVCTCWLGERCICGPSCDCPAKPKPKHNIGALKKTALKYPQRIKVLSSSNSRPAYTPVTWKTSPANPTCCTPQQGYQSVVPISTHISTPTYIPRYTSFNMPQGGFRGSMMRGGYSSSSGGGCGPSG